MKELLNIRLRSIKNSCLESGANVEVGKTMKKEDQWTSLASLNDEEFNSIINEQRNKNTEAANIFADSLIAARKALDDFDSEETQTLKKEKGNMSEKKVNRVLVQGSASFSVSCNDLQALVTPEQAADKKFLDNFFQDKAFKLIYNGNGQEESTIESSIPVVISEDLAQKHTGELITDEMWSEIIQKSKKQEIE